jgi:hypothetical protein
MSATLQMVPYDSWVPENIALSKIEELPWSDSKTRDKAIGLARGLVKSRELGLSSQVNLHFANLKRLAKKSVAESIRHALEGKGLVLEPQSTERAVSPEDYESMIPPDMLDMMGLVQEMIPIAQFKIGVRWSRDPYLLVGIPGGGWYRLGSWYRGDTSHVLVDAGKVNLRELLGG